MPAIPYGAVYSGNRTLVSSDNRLIARLQTDPTAGKTYLWVVNATREPIEATFTMAERWGP